jgi:hypothetical protein
MESCGTSKKDHAAVTEKTAHVAPVSPAARKSLAQAPDASMHFEGDEDDEDSRSYYDGDDEAVRAWGQAPSPSETRRIAAVVKQYYEAAAAGDSAEACSRLYSLIAESAVEVYGEGTGPSYSRGHSCPTVMHKLLRHSLARLFGPVTVVGVRVDGNRARAWLASSRRPAAYMPVRRERGVWKVGELTPTQLP